MERTRVRWLNMLATGVVAATCAFAGPPVVNLKIETREVYVRESVAVQIEVSDFQTCEAPQVPEIPGAVLRLLPGASDASQVMIVNGRRTQSQSRTYSLELTPQATGDLLIPPISIVVDGEARQTKPVRLDVRASDAEQLLGVDIRVGKTRVFVGQRVPLTMTIWVKPARYGNQLLDVGDMLRQVRPIEFGPFPLQVSNATRRPRPNFNAKEPYYAYEFATEFVPERPGPLAFDNVEVGLAYPTARGARNLRARPTVPAVDVLAVPSEGRPPGFNGAVGLFQIQTTAEPTQVRVGDPIELTIEISGDGPIATLPPPLLAENAALADGFRLPTEQLAGEVHEARRRYKLTIRARREDVREIPPVEYPYFDPTFERFVVARSKAIPLTVAPAMEVMLPDMPPPHSARPESSAALQALDGLRDIETSETALLSTTAPITPQLVLATLAIPAGVFLLLWRGVAYVQGRAADPARRRRQAALRTARARLARARTLPPRESAAEIRAALAGYLADRMAEPEARFAGAALVDVLRARNVASTISEQWATVTRCCDEAVYAPGAPADGEALRSQALHCLRALERHKL